MGFISRPGIAVLMLLAGLAAGPLATVNAEPHTVDLIPLIDVKRDAVNGKWKVDHGAIVSDKAWNARLRIPYEPPEEYDFHIDFIRKTGNNDVGQIFTHGGKSCFWVMGAWGNSTCGFSTIDGWDPSHEENPTRFKANAILQNGKKYSSVVRVRKGSVVASIDGTVVSKCSLDSSKFGIPGGYSLGADGLGVGSWGSEVEFDTIEVLEISGPGKASPRSGAKPDDGEQVAKKNEKPADGPALHTDVSTVDAPVDGPTTRPAHALSTIKSLEIQETDSGMMLGETSEVVLTVTPGQASKPLSVRFVTPIGDQMSLARDEALRYTRVTYPNWYADKAELTFEDKYNGHEGGSIGAAIGTLILSSIQGFTIDPDTAITGDISANGKVRAIGGVSAKLRGAVASRCRIVALPMDNYDQLVDTLVYSGLPAVSDVQIIGIANLNDAVAVTRSDRDGKLAKVIELFAGIQQGIKTLPGYLHSKEAVTSLNQVVELAPNHLSAKLMLMKAQGKQPKTLSPTASMYYTFVAVRAMLPILAARSQMDNPPAVPSTVAKEGLIALRKLRSLADENVRPLIDAWIRFIGGWSEFQNGEQTRKGLAAQADAVDDAMAKLQADQDLMPPPVISELQSRRGRTNIPPAA